MTGKKYLSFFDRFILCLLCLFFFLPLSSVKAANLKGAVLRDVNNKNNFWYLNPTDNRIYYLGDKKTAVTNFREMSVKVGLGELNEIKLNTLDILDLDSDRDGLSDFLETSLGLDPYKIDSDWDGYSDLTEVKSSHNPLGAGKIGLKKETCQRLSGKILKATTDKNSSYWYVNPSNCEKYFLGDNSRTAQVLEKLSVAVDKNFLSKLEKGYLPESYKGFKNVWSGAYAGDALTVFLYESNELDQYGLPLRLKLEIRNDSGYNYSFKANISNDIRALGLDFSADPKKCIGDKNFCLYKEWNVGSGELKGSRIVKDFDLSKASKIVGQSGDSYFYNLKLNLRGKKNKAKNEVYFAINGYYSSFPVINRYQVYSGENLALEGAGSGAPMTPSYHLFYSKDKFLKNGKPFSGWSYATAGGNKVEYKNGIKSRLVYYDNINSLKRSREITLNDKGGAVERKYYPYSRQIAEEVTYKNFIKGLVLKTRRWSEKGIEIKSK